MTKKESDKYLKEIDKLNKIGDEKGLYKLYTKILNKEISKKIPDFPQLKDTDKDGFHDEHKIYLSSQHQLNGRGLHYKGYPFNCINCRGNKDDIEKWLKNDKSLFDTLWDESEKDSPYQEGVDVKVAILENSGKLNGFDSFRMFLEAVKYIEMHQELDYDDYFKYCQERSEKEDMEK